ncbi:MAG TPA: hypothetical protein PK413_12490 [Thermoanaerobaculia bacterium]|nr:hypothetical protein [Thermoanaerobaculia bacterium]
MAVNLEELALIVGIFLLSSLGVLVWRRALRARAQLQMRRLEVLEKVVERLGTAEEFVALARTEEGKELLASGSPAWDLRGRLVVLLVLGVVLLAVGVGLHLNAASLATARLPPEVTTPTLVEAMAQDLAAHREDASWWSNVTMAVGVGLTGLAGLLLMLGERWGLLSGAGSRARSAE